MTHADAMRLFWMSAVAAAMHTFLLTIILYVVADIRDHRRKERADGR